MNRFKIAQGREAEFESAWRNRESHLDGVPGFVSFWLLKGPEGDFISCTRWESESAFIQWTESEAFQKAHRSAGLPEGVVAGPPKFSGYEVILKQGRE